jgi:transcriptional repressor NF-X1
MFCTYCFNNINNRPLSCGNHFCEKPCHAGPCGECLLLPSVVYTCPCGKIPLELLTTKFRKSCLDEVITCPNTCEKNLKCGVHLCKEICHNGPCTQECTQPVCFIIFIVSHKKCFQVEIKCRCNFTTIIVPCNKRDIEQVHCNKVCKSLRTCGRHQCGLKCCPSSTQSDPQEIDSTGSHICNLICDKKLKCGKHKCDLLCHSGR